MMAFQALGAATAAFSAYDTNRKGRKALRIQGAAADQARQDAARAASASEREINRANQKTPNLAALMKRNMDASSAGVGGTFLTGSGGAPVAAGMLGRSTLLGR